MSDVPTGKNIVRIAVSGKLYLVRFVDDLPDAIFLCTFYRFEKYRNGAGRDAWHAVRTARSHQHIVWRRAAGRDLGPTLQPIYAKALELFAAGDLENRIQLEHERADAPLFMEELPL